MNASFNASIDGALLSNRLMKVMYNEVINDTRHSGEKSPLMELLMSPDKKSRVQPKIHNSKETFATLKKNQDLNSLNLQHKS